MRSFIPVVAIATLTLGRHGHGFVLAQSQTTRVPTAASGAVNIRQQSHGQSRAERAVDRRFRAGDDRGDRHDVVCEAAGALRDHLGRRRQNKWRGCST